MIFSVSYVFLTSYNNLTSTLSISASTCLCLSHIGPSNLHRSQKVPMMENASLSQCFYCSDSTLNIPGFTVNFLLAVPANSWVLWLIMTSAGFLTDKMEVFEFNMALNELLFCLFTPVISIGIYLFKTVVDKYMLFFTIPIFTVRPVFQTCICLERYLAVVHPVVFLRYRVW